MNTKYLTLTAAALGLVLATACKSSHPSDQPWDKPVPENNNPGYNTPNPFPMDRGTKGTNAD